MSLLLLAGLAADLRRLDGSKISIEEADAFARKTLAEAHVTGAQIAIVDQGRLVWSAAYGWRAKNPDLPMTTATTTWAASLTKSVFATYVMQLVERGEFDLDMPVARQLAIEQFEPYKETASLLVGDPRWATVTPRQLLAHATGLANFAFLEPDKKMHLSFAPGSNFRYSGEGFNLVQVLIEKKKGRPLADLMQEAIFAPLGMKATGMVHRQEFEQNVADRFDADEKFRAQTRRGPARAAGNMATSVEDLARFVGALLRGKS